MEAEGSVVDSAAVLVVGYQHVENVENVESAELVPETLLVAGNAEIVGGVELLSEI